jgi:Cu/Ag efflux protein CusF
MMWIMIRRFTMLLLAALAIALAACGGAKDPPKRYAMQGEVKALDQAAKTATIAHEKIGDWMGAMTMEYSVKPDAEFQKLHVGDKIQATVVVEGDVRWYVTGVNVTPK